MQNAGALDKVNEILKQAVSRRASDIHMKPGIPPVYRIDGSLVAFKDSQRLMPQEIRDIAFNIMNDKQRERFKELMDLDMAYGIPGVGRFRVNIY